jgi:Sugar-specific transcriptional regulator TrmB
VAVRVLHLDPASLAPTNSYFVDKERFVDVLTNLDSGHLAVEQDQHRLVLEGVAATLREVQRSPVVTEREPVRQWTFITNHAQVLLAVAQRPELRVREIASAAAISLRYAYLILRDLENSGYVERRRHGRCNFYRIHPELLIGDPVVEEQSLWELLHLIGKERSEPDVVASVASVRRLGQKRRRASRPHGRIGRAKG